MATCNKEAEKDEIKTNTMSLDKNLDVVNHLASADRDSFLEDKPLAADMAVKKDSSNEIGSTSCSRKEENHIFENNLNNDKLCNLDENMDMSDITSTCSMEESATDAKKEFTTASSSQDSIEKEFNSFSSLQNLELFVKKDLNSSEQILQNTDIMKKDSKNTISFEKDCDSSSYFVQNVDSDANIDYNSLQSTRTCDSDMKDSDTTKNEQNIDSDTKKDYNLSQSTEHCDSDVKDSDTLNADCNTLQDSNTSQLKENCDTEMKDSGPLDSEQIMDVLFDSETKKNSTNCSDMKEDSNVSNVMTNSEIERKEESKPDLTQENLLKKLGFESLNHISLNGKTTESDVPMTTDDISKTTGNNLKNDTENNTTENGLKGKSSDGVLEEIKLEENIQKWRSSSPCPIINGFIEIKKGNTEGNENKDVKKVDDQKTRVNILKEELRVEEAKLLLLRKLLESQCTRKNGAPVKIKDGIHKPINLPSLHPKQNVGRPDNSHGHYPPSSYIGSASHYGSVQIAPKIVLPSKSNAAGLNLPKVVPSIVSAPKTDANISTVPPGARVANYVPLHNAATTANSQPVHKYYIQVGNQLVPAAPPVNQPVYAMPAYVTTTAAQPKVMALQTTQANQNAKPQPISTAESQASKHSAAKAALRRQLEQTLLQIPPPRPPPADWNAVPNVNSIDFMMLVGLDEVVDMVLDIGGKPTLKQLIADFMPKGPSICKQCDVDFSPAWKTKPISNDKGENKTLCEKCSMMNVKKELKSEHTSRLKSAFLKALKQEQEIEEKIKAGEDVIISSIPSSDKDHSGQQVVQHHTQQAGHVHQLHQPHQHQTHSGQVDHHHQAYRHHHHQIVQHYPHHNSLVHQLHQQHMQQQQVEYDKNGRRTSSSSNSNNSSSTTRWHPYMPSHHHSSHVHNPQHHRTGRTYVSTTDGRQEYYVVHHPQHPSSSGQHTSVRWTH